MLRFKIDFQFLFLVIIPLPFFLLLYSMELQVTHASTLSFMMLVLLYPITEEIFFRGLIQPYLTHKTDRKVGLLSLANIITSAIFSFLHLFSHPPIWAISTFIPSLVFGYCKDRYQTMHAPIILHIYYNFGYFLAASL